MWGIADRTDYDLTQHQNTSGEDMSYFDDEDGSKYIPYVIEPSLGADRVTLAFLCAAYDEEELESYDDVSYICHIPTELDAKKHTSEISPEEQYNNSITVEDITKDSAIDSSELKVLTYSHPHDTCDGIEIHLGNGSLFPLSI